MGQHYSLPGGSIGKKYIDLLCDELQYLSLGTYRSEHLIVFCSVMLQWDRLVCKGCDICRLLERCMNDLTTIGGTSMTFGGTGSQAP